MVGGFGKLGFFPEFEADALVLLNAKVLETNDIILICHLAQSASPSSVTLVADEVVAVVVALISTHVMATDLTRFIIREARRYVRVARVQGLLRI